MCNTKLHLFQDFKPLFQKKNDEIQLRRPLIWYQSLCGKQLCFPENSDKNPECINSIIHNQLSVAFSPTFVAYCYFYSYFWYQSPGLNRYEI